MCPAIGDSFALLRRRQLGKKQKSSCFRRLGETCSKKLSSKLDPGAVAVFHAHRKKILLWQILNDGNVARHKLFPTKAFVGQKSFGLKSFGQKSFVQMLFGQNSFGQNSFGQKSFVQKLFVQKPFVQKPFGQKPFGQKLFEQKLFEQKPFGQKPFGQKSASRFLYFAAKKSLMLTWPRRQLLPKSVPGSPLCRSDPTPSTPFSARTPKPASLDTGSLLSAPRNRSDRGLYACKLRL
jgi:hypothetical protein